jgi:propionyl-CoA carboxylase beta chain
MSLNVAFKSVKSVKLSARLRLELLVDQGSFKEILGNAVHDCHDFGINKIRISGDGIITGYAKINDKPVFVYSQDSTVFGGSVGKMHSFKLCSILDKAVEMGVPIIGINDSGGARIQEGIDALAGVGEVFQRNVRASGVIPQISLVMGACAGGAVYSPALMDFTFMLKDQSYMYVTGPSVVQTVS